MRKDGLNYAANRSSSYNFKKTKNKLDPGIYLLGLATFRPNRLHANNQGYKINKMNGILVGKPHQSPLIKNSRTKVKKTICTCMVITSIDIHNKSSSYSNAKH